MTSQQDLIVALNEMFDYFGPPLEKTAEEQFMDRFTRAHEDEEIFGAKFVKVAHMQGKSPWGLAYEVAFAYPGLEKAASAGMPLARYYLGWADDMEKSAFLGAIKSIGSKAVNLVRGGGAGAAKNVAKSTSSNWDDAAKNFAKIQRSPNPANITQTGTGKAIGSGRSNAASTASATPAAPSTPMRGPKQIRADRKANIAQGKPGAAPQAPAAAPAAAPGAAPGQGVKWGNVGYGALGTGIVAGTGYLGYKGYQALKGNNQPQGGGYGGGGHNFNKPSGGGKGGIASPTFNNSRGFG